MPRPLLHFLWIGVALFGLDRWLGPSTPPEPVVIASERVEELRGAFQARAGRLPNDAELDGLLFAEVNDELLYREARRQGFVLDDPVVQRRLVQNMRFAGADPERDAASLFSEALKLGMDRSDPVVRRRLVQRMRLAIESEALEPEPTQAELRERYDAHRDSYRQAARVQLVQIFFNREPVGEARTELERLREARAGPEADRSAGDAFLHAAEQPSQSERELAGRFGPDFAREVFELEAGLWSGPIASSYGEHLVWIREQTAEAQRDFDAVRTELQYALLAERRRRLLEQALTALRKEVQVVVARGVEP